MSTAKQDDPVAFAVSSSPSVSRSSKGEGGSLSGEQLGYRATDPPGGAGDDHPPSMESASGGVDPGVIRCA